MNYDKLIEDLRTSLMWCEICSMRHDCIKENASCKTAKMSNAADAIEHLQSENADLKKQLFEKTELLDNAVENLHHGDCVYCKEFDQNNDIIWSKTCKSEKCQRCLNYAWGSMDTDNWKWYGGEQDG